MAEEVYFRDFTQKRKRVYFRVEPDEFDCVSALPPDDLQVVAGMWKSYRGEADETSIAQTLAKLREIFEIFILPKSFEVFSRRLGDRQNPIDVQQLVEIIQWIIEVYAARPTTPSSSSPATSVNGDGGTSSTAGASLAESLPSS